MSARPVLRRPPPTTPRPPARPASRASPCPWLGGVAGLRARMVPARRRGRRPFAPRRVRRPVPGDPTDVDYRRAEQSRRGTQAVLTTDPAAPFPSQRGRPARRPPDDGGRIRRWCAAGRDPGGQPGAGADRESPRRAAGARPSGCQTGGARNGRYGRGEALEVACPKCERSRAARASGGGRGRRSSGRRSRSPPQRLCCAAGLRSAAYGGQCGPGPGTTLSPMCALPCPVCGGPALASGLYGMERRPRALCCTSPAGTSAPPACSRAMCTSFSRSSVAGSPRTIALSTSSSIRQSYASSLLL